MKKFDFSNLAGIDRISGRIDELRQGLAGSNPNLLARNTSADWEAHGDVGGYFRLPLWRRPVVLAYPNWNARRWPSGETLSPMELALLLYYFTIADGFPLSKEWISFADLPDGRFYNQAFYGYTGKELARAFVNDQYSFERTSLSLNGERTDLGDASFVFQALPRASLCVVFWKGDEEFSSTFQILFDAAASHYLTTDSYAILGSIITQRLIAAKAATTKDLRGDAFL
jgi:Domain of unknown function (DUF3786)